VSGEPDLRPAKPFCLLSPEEQRRWNDDFARRSGCSVFLVRLDGRLISSRELADWQEALPDLLAWNEQAKARKRPPSQSTTLD
jgi:hypothetical protein